MNATVTELVERLTSLKYPQAVMDAAEALTRMAAELAAEKAEVERLNKCWAESRASAADAGLALRELANELAAARARIALLTKLVERAYNEAFSEGMKEHTHFNGGKSWSESRARSLLGKQADGSIGGNT